ncbi:MAG: nucleotide exchange factor GrpE [Alphaproteobacteria bacterium]|nr:nucleotide exchange factor GrpE [Rickettsiales bacterium]
MSNISSENTKQNIGNQDTKDYNQDKNTVNDASVVEKASVKEENLNQNSQDESDQNKDDQAKIAELQKDMNQLAEMNKKLMLSLARVQNESKITQKQAEEKASYALSGIAKDMIAVVHTLFLALSSMNKDVDKLTLESFDNCIKGVDMTMKSFISALERSKIIVLNPENDIFDSNLHDALSVVSHAKQEGSIVEVLQFGCTLNGRLIVPAKVIVSAGEEKAKNNQA